MDENPIVLPDGTKEWRRDGKLHREGGPAVERPDGQLEWYRNGDRHREGGPSVILPDGGENWHQNGEMHREDGPAVDLATGTKMWMVRGEFHRLDGPAVERADGKREWWVNGKQHRLDGPAVEYLDGLPRAWWVDGKRHRLDGPAVEYAGGGCEWWVDGEFVSSDRPFEVAQADGTSEWYQHVSVPLSSEPILLPVTVQVRPGTRLLATILSLIIAAVFIGSAFRGGLTYWMALWVAIPFLIGLVFMYSMRRVMFAAFVSGLVASCISIFVGGLGQAAIAFSLAAVAFLAWLFLGYWIRLARRYQDYPAPQMGSRR